MSLADDRLYQEVISDNKQIFERVLGHLQQAQSEILVATAWFTDPILFDALDRKVSQGVKVDLIIADNEENQKLDFQRLIDKRATVLKVKNVGYGMMHQKFCVVDRNIALHGSYNWSINAKNNNHESIIITNHKETVESLITTFFDIEKRAIKMLEGVPVSELNASQETSSNASVLSSSTNNNVDRDKLAPIDEYVKVLDAMIASEVGNFDRVTLRREGYERAKATSGDANILGNAFDSIYSLFVNDINLAEEKKRRLQTKVEDLKAKTIAACSHTNELQIETIETEINTRSEVLKAKALSIKTQSEDNKKEIETINSIKIPEQERRIEALSREVQNAEREFVRPKWRLYELIPVTAFVAVLFSYLFIFYSSAAYILLFSEADAKEARMNGIMITPPEVFNAEAISLVLDKGATAIMLVAFFTFVPMGFSCGRLVSNDKLTKVLFLIFGVVIIDFFIALKVAMEIHDVQFLTGAVNGPFEFKSLLTNPDFYLVFILGAMGLILFKFFFEKLYSLFDERNPDIGAQINKVHIKQLNAEIESHLKEILTLRASVQFHNGTLMQRANELQSVEQTIIELPIRMAEAIEKKKLELTTRIVSIERITDIYKSHIDNDKIPIHVDSMKDRINVFLEGWNDLLHSEYAVARAMEKSKQAKDAAQNWESQKLVKERIDKRINIYE